MKLTSIEFSKAVLKRFEHTDNFEIEYSDTSVYDGTVIDLTENGYLTEKVLAFDQGSMRKKHKLTITPLGRDYLDFLLL